MINDEILAIKDNILQTVGENCERIITNAGFSSGTAIINIKIEDTIEDMKKQILNEAEVHIKNLNISSINHHFFFLPLISNRHFRTPFLPFYFYLVMKDISGLDHNTKENQLDTSP